VLCVALWTERLWPVRSNARSSIVIDGDELIARQRKLIANLLALMQISLCFSTQARVIPEMKTPA
jgi:hypothetical protein